MKSIVTLTMSPAVDQSSKTDFVTDEKKLQCHSLQFDPGGGGINVSRAIHILGGKTKAFYPAGGCTGDLLENLLEEQGIDHYRIDIEENARVNVHILEEKTNRQYRFNMPGPSLREGEWTNCLKVLKDYTSPIDYLVASGSLPPGVPKDFFAQVADFCNEKKVKFILDTSGEPLKHALKQGVYLVKPNLHEFSQLMHQDLEDEDQITEEAQKMIQQGQAEVIVISTGAAGTIVNAKDYVDHIFAPLVPINSRIGAGDCMVAGMTLKLAIGTTLSQAVKYGVASGTAAVITPGTELCRKDDVERLYKKIISSSSRKE